MILSHLASYPKIVVTGPQRSGTTILSRMITHDTGYTHIDEEDIYVRDIPTLESYLNSDDNLVIHCPALSHVCHLYNDHMIVWCVRPVNEIIASQARIGWKAHKEYAAYQAINDPRPIAKIKYDFWYSHQKQLCPHHLEVDYHDLKDHELWVEDRKSFSVRQWKR